MSTKLPQPQSKKPVTPPLISEEADRALGRVLIRYGFFAFALVVMVPVVCGIIYSRYPHDKLVGPNGPLFFASALLWLIPFYIGQNKQSAMRLEYGKRYLAEQRWKQAAAALKSFDEFGQKSFDRTGEAHFLLAQAYDRLGRKDLAEKSREFVRKHRAGTVWAQKLGGVKPAAGTRPAPAIRRKENAVSSDESPAVGAAAGGKKSALGQSSRGRRRRF